MATYNAVMATALIGLGANLGDRAAALETAIELLRAEPEIRVEAVSSFRTSKPAGGPEGQAEFLNAAARLETSLSPEGLLAMLLEIEAQIGRVRAERWGPRVIDLDLLLFDQLELKTPALELPHPRMCYRRFVLEPAAEIAAEMVWPVSGWRVEKLLSNLSTSARYIAVSVSTIPPVHEFLRAIQAESGCRLVLEPDDRECHPLQLSRFSIPEIESSSWPKDSSWTISDFWFDRAIVNADWVYGTNFQANPSTFSRWAKLRTNVVQPRIVFILEDPAQWWNFANEASPSDQTCIFWHRPLTAAARDRFYTMLRLFCRRRECPPTIWLPSDDLEAFKLEVLVAMQAME